MLGSVGSMLSDDQILTHFCSQLINRHRYVPQKVEKYFSFRFSFKFRLILISVAVTGFTIQPFMNMALPWDNQVKLEKSITKVFKNILIGMDDHDKHTGTTGSLLNVMSSIKGRHQLRS